MYQQHIWRVTVRRTLDPRAVLAFVAEPFLALPGSRASTRTVHNVLAAKAVKVQECDVRGKRRVGSDVLCHERILASMVCAGNQSMVKVSSCLDRLW